METFDKAIRIYVQLIHLMKQIGFEPSSSNIKLSDHALLIQDCIIEVFKDIPPELFSEESRKLAHTIQANTLKLDLNEIPTQLQMQMRTVLNMLFGLKQNLHD